MQLGTFEIIVDGFQNMFFFFEIYVIQLIKLFEYSTNNYEAQLYVEEEMNSFVEINLNKIKTLYDVYKVTFNRKIA